MITAVRDISHYNIIPNYPAFRAASSAVQIKVTESTNYIDPMFGRHFVGTAGMFQAAYHFARPVSIVDQIAHFLATKAWCGPWDRPDMLDCEFAGITPAFIRALVAEYRRQSGNQKVQVYIGLHDIVTSCPPELWWDPDIYIQVSRYRKIGPPNDPNTWGAHLGFDHPGLSTYQWDDATPFYPGGPLGDVSFDRVPVTFGGNVMSGEADKLITDFNTKLKAITDATDAGKLDPKITGPVIHKANYDVLIDALGAAQRVEITLRDALFPMFAGLVADLAKTMAVATAIAADVAVIKAVQTGQPTTFVIEPNTFTLKPE